MKTLPWVVAGILAVALATVLALPGSPEEDPRLQQLRTELLEARAGSMGWETRLAAATAGLEARLATTRDSVGLLRGEKAALAREVEAMGARITALVDMYAEARGQIEAQGTVHGTSQEPDSVTAPIDDGLIEGRVAYLPPTSSFSLDYVARLSIVLGLVDAPDGRLLVTARGTDPRVELSYGSVFYQPPPPVRVCSIGTRLEWGAWGVGVGFLGGLMTGLKIPPDADR